MHRCVERNDSQGDRAARLVVRNASSVDGAPRISLLDKTCDIRVLDSDAVARCPGLTLGAPLVRCLWDWKNTSMADLGADEEQEAATCSA